MSPAVALVLLLALSKASSKGGADAAARLIASGVPLTHTATHNLTQFSFPSDEWKGQDPKDPAAVYFVQYASDDPSSYVVSRGFRDGRPAQIVEQGSGPLTASILARAVRLTPA